MHVKRPTSALIEIVITAAFIQLSLWRVANRTDLYQV